MAKYVKFGNTALIIEDQVHVLVEEQSYKGNNVCSRCSLRAFCLVGSRHLGDMRFSELCKESNKARFVNLDLLNADDAQELVYRAFEIQDLGDPVDLYQY